MNWVASSKHTLMGQVSTQHSINTIHYKQISRKHKRVSMKLRSSSVDHPNEVICNLLDFQNSSALSPSKWRHLVRYWGDLQKYLSNQNPRPVRTQHHWDTFEDKGFLWSNFVDLSYQNFAKILKRWAFNFVDSLNCQGKN